MAATPRRGRNFLSRARVPLLLLLTPIGLGALSPAQAQIGSDRYSSMVVEAGSGKILEDVSPDAPRHPASLAKLMTLYMTFEALRDRRITLNEQVPVSPHAASMEPTKLGLVPGSQLTVEQAILGLVTKSANDAAAALGEMLGGTEDRFAQMMTLRARALGMTNTTFTNASGLPDPDEWTTARDLAVLARHLITDFPDEYHYFSTPSFLFHGSMIYNHDGMLRSYPGADGMKTGYTEASGHNLVTSAVVGGVRLIGVVLGASTNAERDVHMATLLDQGFEEMDVPVAHRPARVASSLGLIGVAHAATVDPTPRAAMHPRMAITSVGWAIQVGVYPNERTARAAAVAAHRVAEGGEPRVEPGFAHGRKAWRAQLTGLTGQEAQGTCAALSRHRTPCVVLRPDSREVASR
jgi:D-alanyl-D-alanine carboxypeptidase